jgi:hypothetical protein
VSGCSQSPSPPQGTLFSLADLEILRSAPTTFSGSLPGNNENNLAPLESDHNISSGSTLSGPCHSPVATIDHARMEFRESKLHPGRQVEVGVLPHYEP